MNLKIQFDAVTGLVPTIVQNYRTGAVLMLGYMNRESFEQTLTTEKVTFYSRSRQKIWVKGETSGNFLKLISWSLDCDQDAILVQAEPQGPTCHTGSSSCFGETAQKNPISFLSELQAIIEQRFDSNSTPAPKTGVREADAESYVARLKARGRDRIIQKVGEEAIETVIAAKNNDTVDFENEMADLIFHSMILLKEKNSSLENICRVLQARNTAAVSK